MTDTVNPNTQSLDAQISSLRAELKQWEKSFASSNDTRKPCREDIKQNPTIAAKYKEYARLRQRCSSSQKTKSASGATPRSHPATPSRGQHSAKRSYPFNDISYDGQGSTTPTKYSKPNPRTPSGEKRFHPAQLDPYDSPSSVKRLQNPDNPEAPEELSILQAIGPTPQRDGKALGLFDLLSSTKKTPTSSRTRQNTTINAGDAPQTPSRNTRHSAAEESGNSVTHRARHSITPASSGRKFYLANFFATPTTTRYSNTTGQDQTPSAGRQTLQGKQDDSTRKRSSEPGTPSFLKRTNFEPSKITDHGLPLADSISPVAVRMPQKLFGKGLSSIAKGYQNDESDSEADEALQYSEEQFEHPEATGPQDGDENQSPTKNYSRYKKRGQKRTTKLVRMRPVQKKPPTDTIGDEPIDAVENGGDASLPQGNGNKLLRKARKINQEAHANYRALKIRGKNRVKAGMRTGMKFGRKRS